MHIKLLILIYLRIEESALRVLLERITARNVPPSISVLIEEVKLVEDQYWVSDSASTEWSTLQDTFFKEDGVIGYLVKLVCHGEKHSVSFV